MTKVETKINLDIDLLKKAEALFSELGMDLTTAVTIFLNEAVRIQGIPFEIKKDIPNDSTIKAFSEYDEMKNNPKKYKRYNSITEAIGELL